MNKKQERIIVLYKPHGTKVSVMRKAFDGKVHELIPEKVEPAEVVDPAILEELNALYTEKTGKVAHGGWAKNVEWLKGKIEA